MEVTSIECGDRRLAHTFCECDERRVGPAQRKVGVRLYTAQLGQPARWRAWTVEVSFDDGATWRGVPMVARTLALVTHPPSGGFVSLRATAADVDGNAVTETIIRAYQLR